MKNIPESLVREMSEEEKAYEREFYENEENVKKYIPSLALYTPKQMLRMCRIEFFDINPQTEAEEKTAVLFNYYGRDVLLNKADASVIFRG